MLNLSRRLLVSCLSVATALSSVSSTVLAGDSQLPDKRRTLLDNSVDPWHLVVKIVTDKGVFTGIVVGKHQVLTAANNVYISENSTLPAARKGEASVKLKRGQLITSNIYVVGARKKDGKEVPHRVIGIRPGTTFSAAKDRALGISMSTDERLTPRSEFAYAVLQTEDDLGSYWGYAEMSRKNASDYDGSQKLLSVSYHFDGKNNPIALMDTCDLAPNADFGPFIKSDCIFSRGGYGGGEFVKDIPDEDPGQMQYVLFSLHVSMEKPRNAQTVADKYNLNDSYTYSIKSISFIDTIMQLRKAEGMGFDAKGKPRDNWGQFTTLERICSTLPSPCPIDPVESTESALMAQLEVTPQSFPRNAAFIPVSAVATSPAAHSTQTADTQSEDSLQRLLNGVLGQKGPVSQ